jgi:hypothetical protein
MTPLEQAPPRIRWYRRRPEDGMPPLARAAWWAGHGQLFVAAALLVAGVPLFVTSLSLHGLAAVRFWALLALGMVLPFVCSGSMLRWYAGELARDGRGIAVRLLTLTLVVAGIAVVAVAFAILCTYALVLLFIGALYSA